MTLLSRASHSLQQEHMQMRLPVSSAFPATSREGREREGRVPSTYPQLPWEKKEERGAPAAATGKATHHRDKPKKKKKVGIPLNPSIIVMTLCVYITV